MTYRVTLIGGAHDGDEVVTDERPPVWIRRVHRAGGRVITTTYLDSGDVAADDSLIYIAEKHK